MLNFLLCLCSCICLPFVLSFGPTKSGHRVLGAVWELRHCFRVKLVYILRLQLIVILLSISLPITERFVIFALKERGYVFIWVRCLFVSRIMRKALNQCAPNMVEGWGMGRGKKPLNFGVDPVKEADLRSFFVFFLNIVRYIFQHFWPCGCTLCLIKYLICIYLIN